MASPVPLDTFRSAILTPWTEKWGYVYGASGQKCSPAFRQSCADANPSQASMILGAAAKWDGRTVCDCSGLARWAYGKLQSGEKRPWSGASTMWRTCIVDQQAIDNKTWKGAAGWAVFRNEGKNPDGSLNMAHTAILYDADDVIEMRGTLAGVCRGKVSAVKWTHAGRFAWVSYEESVPITPPTEEPKISNPNNPKQYVVRTKRDGFISLWDDVDKNKPLFKIPDGTIITAGGGLCASFSDRTMLYIALPCEEGGFDCGYVDSSYLVEVEL